MGKHGIVHGVGINDMPRGWRSANEYNYRVYQLWQHMINRCYDKKFHERQPTYIGCTVCERWLKLSNFVEDIVKIDNYEYWRNNPNERVALDKDIKSNGQCKEYSLENCCFTTIEENSRQAMHGRTGEKAPMYDVHRYGENSPNLGSLIDRFDKQWNLIDTKYQFEYVQMGFQSGNITACCKGRLKTHKGYIFKYHEEDK